MKAKIVAEPCSFFSGLYLALNISGEEVPDAYGVREMSFRVTAARYPQLDDGEDHETMRAFLELLAAKINKEESCQEST